MGVWLSPQEFQDQILSPRLPLLRKSLDFLEAANFPKASPHDRSRESPSDRFAVPVSAQAVLESRGRTKVRQRPVRVGLRAWSHRRLHERVGTRASTAD